jgi:hypothetical protein
MYVSQSFYLEQRKAVCIQISLLAAAGVVVVGGGEGEEGKTAIETFTLNNSHDQK